MPYFLSLLSLTPPFFSLKHFKSSNRCPTRIVIFWQSPRKNYIFLCLSGSCLLFSMCEGKKWVGVPPWCVCGRLDDMVGNGEGMDLGPLGGKGREGVEMLMHHRFLPLKPSPFITIARPCHFFFFFFFEIYAPSMSFKDLFKLVVNSQPARDSTKPRLRHHSRALDLSQETNMVTIKPLCVSHNKEKGVCHTWSLTLWWSNIGSLDSTVRENNGYVFWTKKKRPSPPRCTPLLRHWMGRT